MNTTTNNTIIPRNLIEGANNNSFFDRGSGLERDAQIESKYFASCKEITKLFKLLGGWTEEQADLLEEREASWRALVKEQYTAQANFNASNTPWFIAGPAKYNQSRYNRKCDSAMRKFEEFNDKKDRFIKNTVSMLLKITPAEKQIELWRKGRQGYGTTIAADDPLAVEKMEAHIEFLKESHEKHIKWNKVLRKDGNADNCEGLSDKAKADINDFLKRNPCYARCGYFCTTNETADIRNKTKRLEDLKKHRAIAQEEKAEGLTLGAMEKDGLRLVENHEAARVQLFFDGKPDEETRNKLKANGFRWSPRFGAWQRQNTPNGVYIARQFFESYKEN